ncbi:abortive infection family protein [Streptomyces sp. WMMC1477]|uniref:abortive infection family protein n=1 Tax=Streptomyces sp. WMMC1477 TaxID=3015155 RepID=UPI0022B5F056|nr:abortive infection family protein [Streptomyces sp. WMMC1477]MCZ7430154.1 abortive infection family protein [Streptomyces sp. WMMC1477]
MQESLPRAQWLQEENWRAVCDHHRRLATAVEADDRPQIVGSAKELVECVARVVLAADGRVTSDNDDYSKVLNQAHKVIEHVVGSDVPANDPLRQVPGQAKKMATQLAEMRNRFGTGHGRAVLHPITDEVVEACVHGSLIWVRWALARLQTVLRGAVVPLVTALREETFTRGELAERLKAANVPDLEKMDQRKLGLAVGRRAVQETFMVRIEGIDVCAENPERWPDGYRRGVVEGLFINEDGQVETYPPISEASAVQLLGHHSAPDDVLQELHSLLRSASWSGRFRQQHKDTLNQMRSSAPFVPERGQARWNEIISDLESRAPDGRPSGW